MLACCAFLLLGARLPAQEAGGAEAKTENPAQQPPAGAAPARDDGAPRAVGETKAPLRRVGAYEVSGALGFGVRAFEVRGNDAQFEEDTNLEEGLFLQDFELAGRRVAPGAGPESFGLVASGIGTRNASVRADAAFSGVDVFGRYARTRYVAAADDDLHQFDFERERASLGLARENDGGTLRRAGLELDWSRRDGFVFGTRNVGNRFVPGVPANLDERHLGGEGRLGLQLGATELEIELGAEQRGARDRREFEAPHPLFPQSVISEDFAADLDGHGWHGCLRGRWPRAGKALALDTGLSVRSLHDEGELALEETGIFNDPSLPFVSETAGESDFEARALSADAGMTWTLPDGIGVELRYVHDEEREDGVLDRTVTLDELSGDPPSVSSFVDDVRRRRAADRLELAVETPIVRWLELELAVDAGREDIEISDVSDGVVVRRFDGAVDAAGAEATLRAEIRRSSTLELCGGLARRPTESSDVGVDFTFDDTRTDFAAASWRWRPQDGATLVARARHDQRRSSAFESEGTSDSFGLSGSARVARELALEASLGYRSFDLEADTTFIVLDPGPTQVPGVVSFDGDQRLGSAGASWDAGESVRATLFASVARGSGDATFDYDSLDLDVAWRCASALELGAGLGWLRFDGSGELEPRDYDARVLTLHARGSF